MPRAFFLTLVLMLVLAAGVGCKSHGATADNNLDAGVTTTAVTLVAPARPLPPTIIVNNALPVPPIEPPSSPPIVYVNVPPLVVTV